MFVRKKNVRRFDVAMHQPFGLGRAQTLRHLDSRFEHLFLRDAFLFFDYVIEASVIDLFIEIPLPWRSRKKYLDDMRMIDRCHDARFLLQLRGVIRIGAQFFAQKFQGHESIQSRVPRLVDRTHPAGPKRFQENEIVERSLDANLFAAFGTIHARKRFRVGRVDCRAASGTFLQNRLRVFSSHRANSNIRY